MVSASTGLVLEQTRPSLCPTRLACLLQWLPTPICWHSQYYLHPFLVAMSACSPSLVLSVTSPHSPA